MLRFLLSGLVLLIFCTSSFAVENYKEPLTGMEFVSVKGGSFVMGDISGRDRFATPAHRVTVNDFWIGKYTVTFEQYDQFCKATDRKKPNDEGWGRGQRPVINVSWNDAVAFTKWLSSKSGKTFRLPSEAEWEYAARGGTTTKYPWGNQIGHVLANCDGCGSKWDRKMTAPVGSFSPNNFGLYDTVGNVYEWTLDDLNQSTKNYKGMPIDGTAWTSKDTKAKRINRGGSYLEATNEMPVYRRCWDSPAGRSKTTGFRVVMEP